MRLYAAENNPGLSALYEAWRAQAERAPQARALPEARFTYVEYLRSVETRTGPQERSFALTQSFPWFEKLRLRGSIEEAKAAAAWQRFLAAQLDLDRELRSTLAEYYYLGRSVTITRENLDLLARLERVARRRLAAGAENHPDLLRLQVEIGRLEDGLRTLLDTERPLRAKLNSLLHLPVERAIEWPRELLTSAAEIDADSVLAFVDANNPELLALREEIEGAAMQKKLAAREYVPDLTVGVQTIATGSARAPGTRDSGEDPWMLSFSIELPIWWQKYRAGEREADALWRSARERHAGARDRLRASVELALFHLRDAERRITLYEETLIPKAEESLGSTESSFESGGSDFLDLIDAERVYLEFQLARERARADRVRAEAELDRLLGRFVIPLTQREESR